jgi:hypothetical protein
MGVVPPSLYPITFKELKDKNAMQNNPDQCPTWDEFLHPLLDLVEKEPINHR